MLVDPLAHQVGVKPVRQSHLRVRDQAFLDDCALAGFAEEALAVVRHPLRLNG